MVRPDRFFVFCCAVCACTCMRIGVGDVWANWYGPARLLYRRTSELVKRRKQLNSISATAFKTAREPVNVLETWRKSLRKFSVPGKEVGSLRLFPSLYDSKSSALLGLVASLWAQMPDFSLCSSHEGRSFAEVRGGLYEVQWKCFFSLLLLLYYFSPSTQPTF